MPDRQVVFSTIQPHIFARCVGSNAIFRCCFEPADLDFARLEFYLHATVERTAQESDRVPVVVWEISDRDERSLDYYEGYPRYYIKEEWPVRMDDGSEMQGMIYLMADIHEHLPTREYYGGIERAYHELGLTEEIAGVLEPALARARHRAKMRRGTRSGK